MNPFKAILEDIETFEEKFIEAAGLTKEEFERACSIGLHFKTPTYDITLVSRVSNRFVIHLRSGLGMYNPVYDSYWVLKEVEEIVKNEVLPS